MRYRLQWPEDFLSELQKKWPKNAALKAAETAGVELGLFFLHQYFPDMPAAQLWFVLAGYPLPGKAEAHRDTWGSLVRYHLAPYQGPYEWEQALENYRKLPETARSYTFNQAGCPVPCPSPPDGPDRTGVYRCLLSTPPPYRVRTQPMVWSKVFTYEVRRSGNGTPTRQLKREISFGNMPRLSSPPGHDLQTPLTPRTPLTISWDDLVVTAQWMDEQLRQKKFPEAFWEQRMKRIRLESRRNGGDGISSSVLTINRLYHMCGMISAGKSTFMDVLAVHLARLQRRTTVVVSDVMNVLERVDMYRRLGVEAVPILGESQPSAHLQRFYGGPLPQHVLTGGGKAHGAERYLDTACAVLAVHGEVHIPPEDYPCTRLEAVGQELSQKENNRKAKLARCPLHGVCGVHRAQNEAAAAAIWVTTPAGLLYVAVNLEVNAEEIRWAELAVRTHDLIIIDEADRVQEYLDITFNPTVTLTGKSSLLTFIDEALPIGSRNDFNAMAHKEVGYWIQTYETIRTVIRRFYALLCAEPFLHAWLLRLVHFTDLSLFERIFADMFPEGKGPEGLAAMRIEVRKFLDDPFGETNLEGGHQLPPLATLANGSVNLTGDPGRQTLRQGITNWLKQWNESGSAWQTMGQEEQRRLVVRLELTLLTTVLQNRLYRLLRQWQAVEKHLPSNTRPPFQGTPMDYVGILPAAPMGNTLAFQYSQSEDMDEFKDIGVLRLMRYGGVGRWLMLNLSALLVGETSAGAHTLLLSGTSWAGRSSTFHIQAPVDGVLCAPEPELAAIRNSVFVFSPMYSRLSSTPIRISGLPPDKRAQTLHELCELLDGWLEQTLNRLPEGRRKLLLLTTSYEETRLVAETLSWNPAWKEKVRYLVRDRDTPDNHRKEALQRGRIAEFGKGPEALLVAPLGAVERGHNILNAQGVAAIGAAVFLVRPHPPADDLAFTTLSTNHWAMDYFQSAPSRKPDPDWAPETFRRWAYRRWCRLLRQPVRYSALSREDRADFIWTQLVLLWQTIGRLIRGGQRAEVYFIDAAFAPRTAQKNGRRDTVRTSLLVGMRRALASYFSSEPEEGIDEEEQRLVRQLYEPFYLALRDIQGLPPMTDEEDDEPPK